MMGAAVAFQESLDGAAVAQIAWPHPDMSVLSAGRSAPPKMPTDLFGPLWPLVSDLAAGASAPVDYVGVSLLAVAASLVGGKRAIRPFSTTDWKEFCILWMALVGDPSSNKSPAIDAATGELRPLEVAHAEAHRGTVQDYETRKERAKAERKAWEEDVKTATKNGEQTPRQPDAAVDPEEPARRRLIVQDSTPEQLGVILSGNPFGTLHLRDEIAGWLMSFDRYSPGGREFWLEAYGGRPHVIDRKSQLRPLHIPFNGVTVLGGIQPEKLQECLLSGSDDGLVARFLWAWPDPVPFTRPRNLADTDRLTRIYQRLDRLEVRTDPFTGKAEGICLPLNERGADIFEAWMRDNSSGIQDAASLYKGFCGKLKGMVLRLALASEFLRWADGPDMREPSEVSADSLIAAIEFVEDYAKPTAQRVFGDAALPAAERYAATLARYILRQQLRQINARVLVRTAGIPPALKKAGAMDDAIEHLVEADWLKPSPGRAGETSGRARKDYTVNPLVFEVTL